jgi:hypothetical protein
MQKPWFNMKSAHFGECFSKGRQHSSTRCHRTGPQVPQNEGLLPGKPPGTFRGIQGRCLDLFRLKIVTFPPNKVDIMYLEWVGALSIQGSTFQRIMAKVPSQMFSVKRAHFQPGATCISP